MRDLTKHTLDPQEAHPDLRLQLATCRGSVTPTPAALVPHSPSQVKAENGLLNVHPLSVPLQLSVPSYLNILLSEGHECFSQSILPYNSPAWISNQEDSKSLSHLPFPLQQQPPTPVSSQPRLCNLARLCVRLLRHTLATASIHTRSW